MNIEQGMSKDGAPKARVFRANIWREAPPSFDILNSLFFIRYSRLWRFFFQAKSWKKLRPYGPLKASLNESNRHQLYLDVESYMIGKKLSARWVSKPSISFLTFLP